MTDKELFIIIKAILWFNQYITQMPSNQEIMHFIIEHKKDDMEDLYNKTINMLKK